MTEDSMENNAQKVTELVCEDFKAFYSPKSSSNCKVICFEGKIGNNNSYEINHKIPQLFNAEDGHCVLDLEKLEYMNSTGVAILFSLYFRIKESGKLFLIGNLHPFLKRIFNLMDFPEGLEIIGNTDDAIQQITK